MTMAVGSAVPQTEISFRQDPLGYFNQHLESGDEVFWLSPTTVCVAPPDAAKAVLANTGGLFKENSDFFHTRRGPFGPRSLQLELARGARQLLTSHVAARRDLIAATVEAVLGRSSHWPDAGNRLMYRYFGPVLLAPDRAGGLGRRLATLLDRVLENAVQAGARERRSRITRAFFRRRVFHALRREVERRAQPQTASRDAPRDLFDVLALGVKSGARSADLGELYLPFFFAITGSVGFTLAWALRLLGQTPVDEVGDKVESAWIVREALRLWPIAWQMDRYPAQAHTLAGVEVTPETTVLISPYVTQRHPAYWREPSRFDPLRWAESSHHHAFLPFGWGPHTCAAASLSLEVAADTLDVIRRSYRIQTAALSQTPFTGPSLAPPGFRLDLTPRSL